MYKLLLYIFVHGYFNIINESGIMSLLIFPFRVLSFILLLYRATVVFSDCDGIDQHRYNELSKDQRTSYTCILCRGEKEERLDAFHRKNR